MIYSLKFTDNIPEGTGAYAKAWFIRIRPAYKDDRGILAHEMEHIKQWWRLLFLHSALYLFCRRYRQWAETQAYKEQLKWPPATDAVDEYRRIYAVFLVKKYKLGISAETAYRLLGG